VHFNGSPKYIIFECKSSLPQCNNYDDADTSKNIPIDSAYGVRVNDDTLFDVVFNQLDANCVMGCSAITVTVNGKTQTIDINSEGRISW
jgi:hypothetical protein